jgi:acetyl-CoA synthetase
MAEEKSSATGAEGLYPPSKEFVEQAYVKSRAQYEQMWKESIANPEKFWGDIASELFWFKIMGQGQRGKLRKGDIKWFLGGKT